jgi:hypothetical protein
MILTRSFTVETLYWRSKSENNQNPGFMLFRARDILNLKTPATAENKIELSNTNLLSYSRIHVLGSNWTTEAAQFL